MSNDSAAKYDSLADHIRWLLLKGATYHDAPYLGAGVLDLIDAFLARFICYPSEHARHAHVLWIAHCLFVNCWYHTPRLLFVSPEASCGKSRCLTVTELLVPRADLVSGLTAASFYSSIDEGLESKGGRPTVLYDELDTVFGSAEAGRIRNEPIRQLINAGHSRNGAISRKHGKKNKRFSLYAPLAMAGKMTVDDVPDTIHTRSVIVPLQRPLPEEDPEEWDDRSVAEAKPLLWLLRLWAELVYEHALVHRPDIPEGIRGRDADVWRPLLGVGDLAGGRWPELARITALTTITAAGVDAIPSEGLQLLWAIRTIFDGLEADEITSKSLLAELNKNDDFPWSGLSAQRAGMKMARVLKGYGIGPTAFFANGKTFKGYRREHFTDAWRRYPPPTGGNGGNGGNGQKDK